MNTTLKKVLNFIYKHTGPLYLIALGLTFILNLFGNFSTGFKDHSFFFYLGVSAVTAFISANSLVSFVYHFKQTLAIYGITVLVYLLATQLSFIKYPYAILLITAFIILPLRHFIEMPHGGADAPFFKNESSETIQEVEE